MNCLTLGYQVGFAIIINIILIFAWAVGVLPGEIANSVAGVAVFVLFLWWVASQFMECSSHATYFEPMGSKNAYALVDDE